MSAVLFKLFVIALLAICLGSAVLWLAEIWLDHFEG